MQFFYVTQFTKQPLKTWTTFSISLTLKICLIKSEFHYFSCFFLHFRIFDLDTDHSHQTFDCEFEEKCLGCLKIYLHFDFDAISYLQIKKEIKFNSKTINFQYKLNEIRNALFFNLRLSKCIFIDYNSRKFVCTKRENLPLKLKLKRNGFIQYMDVLKV